MYKAAVRWMIRRNIAALNAGDYRPALAMFADDADADLPRRQLLVPHVPRAATGPARPRRPTGASAEIEAFLQRYVEHGIQMEVEDILVNGPPWNTRVAAVVHDWIARRRRRRRLREPRGAVHPHPLGQDSTPTRTTRTPNAPRRSTRVRRLSTARRAMSSAAATASHQI